MFNLEQSIAEWRQQMLAAGIRSPATLEELEIHLREEIGRQIKAGRSEQNAFEISVPQVGPPKTLESEFKKIERNVMNRRLVVGVGIFILLLGVTMILPALGKHKQRNAAALSAGATFADVKWAGDETIGLALGTTLFVAGAGAASYGFKKRKA